jgi:hypothetical protein
MAFHTKLQLVNKMLRACGHLPVSALDSSGSWPSKTYGTSDAGQAENYLDMATRDTLAREWRQTSRVFAVTVSGAPNTITAPTNAIFARPIGRDERRNWYLQNGTALIYNAEGSTTTFPDGTYQFAVVEDEEVNNIRDPNLQSLCMNNALIEFQSVTSRDTRVDAAYQQVRAVNELSAKRSPMSPPAPQNQPLIPSQPNLQ